MIEYADIIREANEPRSTSLPGLRIRHLGVLHHVRHAPSDFMPGRVTVECLTDRGWRETICAEQRGEVVRQAVAVWRGL